MISVGIDVSKEKSTVCILKPYGELVSRPFEVCHVEKELSELTSMLLRLNDDVRVVMEATGIYHLPVLSYLKEKGLFVAVINPFEMKEYRCQGLRRVKTDKQDAVTISNYGIDHWYRLNEYEAEEGIPTVPSNTPSTKMLVQEAVRVLREVDNTLMIILTQMQALAKGLPEYPVVRAMGGVGDVLAPKLIAEIGDVRRFHSGRALIAHAGIDALPYQSGQFIGTEREISKRGSSSLCKIGYEMMRCLKTHKEPEDAAVYRFILKKEKEGKSKRAAKIEGLNKFLRIYYARVMEVYET